MDKSALAASLSFWACSGLLPRLFFRKDGRLNLNWWLTALPLLTPPWLLVLAAFGVYHAETPKGWELGLGVVSTVLSSIALGLLFFTLGTHRVPISLWHQDNDAPTHIVTYGAYGKIRHPFYSSFLLSMIAVTVLIPHWITGLNLLYGIWRLNSTAAKEEAKLSASSFGAEYRAYITRTGRFVPRPGAARAPRPEPAVAERV